MPAISVSEKVFAISLPHLGRPLTCTFKSHTRSEPLANYRRYYTLIVGSDHNEPKLPFNKSTENIFDNFNQCGKPAVDVSKTIMKGHDAPEKAWPWQVLMFLQLLNNETKFCGGSLLSESWVLTAAHCVINVTLVLFLGVTNASTLEEDFHRNYSGFQMRGAEKIIAHKGFKTHGDDDIALVKLDKAVIFDDYVQPICLPKTGQTFDNGEDRDCYATGWGASNMTHDSGITILQQAKVNIMPQSMCIFSYTLQAIPFDRRILCLDLNDDNSGTCFGDSGGPLACKIDGRFVLAGITHVVPNGRNCSHIYFPPADVRVTEYLEWIAINIQKG